MVHFKLYNEFLLESNINEIIVYHKSDDLEHMLKSDFILDKSKECIFGSAVYFSSSPETYWGKYNCKFSIKLDEPILDMNEKITSSRANMILGEFKKLSLFNENKFNGSYFRFKEDVQMGQIFEKIQELCFKEHSYGRNDFNGSKYFQYFIQKVLKCNSFKYYQNKMTDYVLKETEFGTSYGLYNPKSIKFVDGPF